MIMKMENIIVIIITPTLLWREIRSDDKGVQTEK